MTNLLARLALIAVVVSGCRTSPPLTLPPSETVFSSYVGIAPFGGSPTNALIVFTEDTDHQLSGSITYRSETSALSGLSFDSSDTVRFTYSRSNMIYRVWALSVGMGLDVHVIEPAVYPVFRLNREVFGYNMSGIWTGEMSSTMLQGQRQAVMIMTQSGLTFTGETTVNFYEAWDIMLSSGTITSTSFELGGIIHSAGTYPTAWHGRYTGHDTIRGIWSAGDAAEIDAGEFLFTRSFR